MLKLYRGLLRLYPASYRNQFGDEMIEVFREIEAEPEKENPAARGFSCLREVAGLLRGALREHWRALGGDPSWLSFPTRRFTMHTEFRFPKTTAVLMTIILAGVVLAIEKGEGIVASLTNVNPALGPIQSPHFDFVPAVIFMFAFVYAAAVAGWAILFALRRSGVHRLETSTEKK
jgi:hypothetical protein